MGGEQQLVHDRIRAQLQERFPGWQVWWVKKTGKGYIWCARPNPLINADTPEDLIEAIAKAEAARGA